MKRLFVKTFLALTFFMFLSSPSYAEWDKVVETPGVTLYVDLNRIREINGQAFFWQLLDNSEPMDGIMSTKVYTLVDCSLWQSKPLRMSFHKEPMGRDSGSIFIPEGEDFKSDTVVHHILDKYDLCNLVKQEG